MFVESRRHHRRALDLAVTDLPQTTAVVDFRDAAGGLLAVSEESALTELTYYVAVAPGRPLQPLRDATGAAVVQEVEAGHAYPLPAACCGAGLLALVGDELGTVSLSLKS